MYTIRPKYPDYKKRAPHGPTRNILNHIIKKYWVLFVQENINNKNPPIMGPTVGPTPVQCVKPQHLHYHHHRQEFSHLLTSTRLMIIAKVESTHNTQASKRVS